MIGKQCVLLKRYDLFRGNVPAGTVGKIVGETLSLPNNEVGVIVEFPWAGPCGLPRSLVKVLP